MQNTKRKITEARRLQVAAAMKRRRTKTLPAAGLKEFMVLCPVSRIDELRAFAADLVAQAKSRDD